MAAEIEWIEDKDDNDDESPVDIFTAVPEPFSLQFGEHRIVVKGLQAKYPHLLQSTGLALWRASNAMCDYLIEMDPVDGPWLELGAGLGVCGILAAKLLPDSSFLLTDGDTDTLRNMRENIALNDSRATCQQLIWGSNAESFRQEKLTVMASDVVYAQDSLPPLFQTVKDLAPQRFLLSYAFRTVTIDQVLSCAENYGLSCSKKPDSLEGVYVFEPTHSQF